MVRDEGAFFRADEFEMRMINDEMLIFPEFARTVIVPSVVRVVLPIRVGGPRVVARLKDNAHVGVIRGFPEYATQFGSGGYSDRLHCVVWCALSLQHKTMEPPQALLCHKGAMIFVPRPDECAIPVDEWPRPLQILLGLVESPWKMECTRNEQGQLLFAQKMKIPSHHMRAIFKFLRTGTLPNTDERICVAEEAFAHFGGCNMFDQSLCDWRQHQVDDGPYNPRFPEDDADNLYDWDIATPYMMRDKLDTWELVSTVGGRSEIGIWRSLR